MDVEITDMQRREVAKRMREYDVAEFRESAIVPFLECLGHGYVNWRGILDELADLIDRPTCQNKQVVYNRTAPKELRTDNFTCSACGETFFADGDGVNHPIDWAFCPNCGAEVLND